MSDTDGLTTVRATTARTTGLQTYSNIVTPASNMVSRRKRDLFRDLLHLPKNTQTFPSPSASTSTSIEQETSTPLVLASASHKQLASNKLASDIPLAGKASDTTLISPKEASIPSSSSLSSTSQVATTQQTTTLFQQPIGRVTNFYFVSNISSDNI